MTDLSERLEVLMRNTQFMETTLREDRYRDGTFSSSSGNEVIKILQQTKKELLELMKEALRDEVYIEAAKKQMIPVVAVQIQG